ncbi:hypothetical protein SAG0334_01270 [Streptococcus agalactiae GB00640]|nr:hypothetical protein W903_0991 [Streptococcus agalactiae CNCTC 10/84]EPT85268.1 hypothetical protein SAG0099_01275 [Streptococcus agalactiae BSU247]EPV19279.1 hypothetical protein SAG0334_01270 [Streptococcus agalactiae GB00640]
MWGKAVIRLIQDVIQNLVGQANEITPVYQFDWKLIYWRLKNMDVI